MRQPGLRKAVVFAALTTLLSASCVTTTQSSQMWWADAGGPAPKPGYVEWVREVVERTQGHPAGGALAGAVIGGMLFGHRGHPSLFGALAGAAVGAAASDGASEARIYQLMVQFEDGSRHMFQYADYPPFSPGQPVLWTARGLYPR